MAEEKGNAREGYQCVWKSCPRRLEDLYECPVGPDMESTFLKNL